VFDRARELVKEIEEKVRRCDKCRGLGPINVDSKPYLEHNVYEEWVPERLECLFIAESPPGNSERFFYNPTSKGQLRENLFDLLGIKRKKCDGLLEFKEKGFLLVDAVECRVKKRDGEKVKRSILKKAVRNCSFILKLKLELARLGTAKLVVMGRTALEALEVLGFSELKGLHVMRNFGEVVDSQGFKVFLLFLPFTRNLAKVKRRLKEEGLKELREKLLRFCVSSTSP
jgi:uracil-DNA glycosylase